MIRLTLTVCLVVLFLAPKSCVFLSQYFFYFSFESVQDDSLHDLAWVTDEADGSVIFA